MAIKFDGKEPIELKCEKCGHQFRRFRHQMTRIDGGEYPPGYDVSWYEEYHTECPNCGSELPVIVEG